MNITEFFELSLGRWRSQRSGHHLTFAHFEEVLSTIDIIPLATDDSATAQLLRDQGYTETVSAAGRYQFGSDEVFTLNTEYDRAAAEERIWFANPNVRFLLAMIKTSDGNGITTASFASSIRTLSNK